MTKLYSLQLKNTILENRMLQSQTHDHTNLSESQIYDDLSQIIKSFKCILTAMENICASFYRYEPIAIMTEELKDTIRNLYGYTKMYSGQVDNHSEHKNTFHRFICRLIESISAYKLKFQTLPYFTILSPDINEIENAVISYQQQKNIGSVIKKIHSAINRFCAKMLKKSQSYQKPAQKDDSNNQQKGSQFFPSIGGDYSAQRQNDKLLPFNNGNDGNIKSKKVVESKSQNSINRVMNLLNRRYRTFSCLDIEYQQFKQLFFRSRDSKQELFEDCLQRNSFIYREMVRYGRQFSEYLQRKEMKIFRKNKFIDSLIGKDGQQSNKVKRAKEIEKHDVIMQDNSLNFTKKKVVNHYEQRKTTYVNNQEHSLTVAESSHQRSDTHSPILLSQSQLIGERLSHLASLQHLQNGQLSPQLIERQKQFTLTRGQQYDQKVEEINAQTFFELTKRKKNLQLKKIDISLSNFNTNGEVQSAKIKTKLLNGDVFKKATTQASKQMQEKLNLSIRKNYLHRKYEQALKKNIEDSALELGQHSQKVQNPSPSKYYSAKCIDIEGEQSPSQFGKQRKYLFKTTNKRNLNTGTQFKSLNPSQKKQISTIKNFRKLKVDQVDKIQRLEKMKQMALNHMQICSGGRAIRPALIYRQRQPALNLYTETVQEQFCDMNLGSHKQFELSRRFQ